MTDLETRLRSTLNAVSSRIESESGNPPALPDLIARQAPLRRVHSRHLFIVGAAALVIIAAAIISLWNTPNRANRVTAGPNRVSPATTTLVVPTLVSVTSGDLTVRLITVPGKADETCVAFVGSDRLPSAPVCLASTSTPNVAIASATVGRNTVVYGVGTGIASFAGAAQQIAVGTQEEVVVGSGRALLAVWNVPDADGVIYGSVFDPAERPVTAVFGEGLDGFEPNPRTPLPVDVPLDGRILLAYKHEGQVWAIKETGASVRLTGRNVTGYPVISPDGDNVLFPRDASANFADLVALNIRTGSERVIGAAGTLAFAPDGRLAFAPPFDDTVTVEVAIRSAKSFDEIVRIPIAGSDQVGNVEAIAWSADGRTLLLTTTQGRELWVVDVQRRRAQRINTQPAGLDASWAVGRGTKQGFPVVRTTSDHSEIGTLLLDGTNGTFKGVPMDTSTAEAALRAGDVRSLSPVGSISLQMISGALFTFRPGGEESFVLSDGEATFLVSSSGKLRYLLSEAAGASAP